MKFLKLIFVMALCCMTYTALSSNTSNTYYRSFEWNYKGTTYSLNHSFCTTQYWHCRNQKRRDYDYAHYAKTNGVSYISSLANQLDSMRIRYGFNRYEFLNFVIAFIIEIPYEEEGYADYPKYPIEFFVDGGGDCEDSSIALAVLLKVLDYDCVLIWLYNPSHMGIGIPCNGCSGTYYWKNGEQYFYVETAGKKSSSWSIGELPEGFEGKARIISLEESYSGTQSCSCK